MSENGERGEGVADLIRIEHTLDEVAKNVTAVRIDVGEMKAEARAERVRVNGVEGRVSKLEARRLVEDADLAQAKAEVKAEFEAYKAESKAQSVRRESRLWAALGAVTALLVGFGDRIHL